MGNIIDYVWEQGRLDFKTKPFTVEDALVLAGFSYLNFDKILTEMSDEAVSISSLCKNPAFDSLFENQSHAVEKQALFMAMHESKRFSELKICMYINHIDLRDETQFCAMTLILPEGNTFIGFRGTDVNIVGWHEDFRLALDEPVPGQLLSARYLNDISNCISGKFMVGGHSKGGNLAMYSAMNCSEDVQKRIKKVYSFDGPGFNPKVLEKSGFDKIKKRTVSVIPKSSYVGLLLNTDENSIVVSSKAVGAFQHNFFNWVITNSKFEKTRLSEQHLLLLSTFNEWMLGLDEEHLNGFINMLVEGLDATEAKNTLEINADPYGTFLNVLKAAKDLDDETRFFLSELVKSFGTLVKVRVKKEVKKEMQKKAKQIGIEKLN